MPHDLTPATRTFTAPWTADLQNPTTQKLATYVSFSLLYGSHQALTSIPAGILGFYTLKMCQPQPHQLNLRYAARVNALGSVLIGLFIAYHNRTYRAPNQLIEAVTNSDDTPSIRTTLEAAALNSVACVVGAGALRQIKSVGGFAHAGVLGVTGSLVATTTILLFSRLASTKITEDFNYAPNGITMFNFPSRSEPRP